jgi:hypothetical protein
VLARAAGKEVTLLDYGAGNVRSVRNAIKSLGYSIKDVSGLQRRAQSIWHARCCAAAHGNRVLSLPDMGSSPIILLFMPVYSLFAVHDKHASMCLTPSRPVCMVRLRSRRTSRQQTS